MNQLKEKLRELMDAFSRLSEKERTIVLGVVVVVSTLSLVGGTWGLLRAIDRTGAQVASKSEQLKQILSMREVLRRAKEQNATFRARLVRNDIRLVALLEEQAKQIGIELGNLTPLPDTEPTPSGVKTQMLDVRAQKLSYDKLTSLLQKLEEQSNPVRVVKLKVHNRYDEKDLVDVEMTVATYKAS